MEEKELEETLEKTIQEHQYQKVNDELYLTNYQTKVLDEFHIPYKDCKSARDILFLLEDTYDDEEFEELDEIARQIEEYSYYHETNKWWLLG